MRISGLANDFQQLDSATKKIYRRVMALPLGKKHHTISKGVSKLFGNPEQLNAPSMKSKGNNETSWQFIRKDYLARQLAIG
jgi:gamma-glutamylcysteine synthetase